MKTKTRAQNGTRSAHAHQLAKGWENLVHHDQKSTGKISLGNYWIFLTLVIKSYWKISSGNHWAFLKFSIKKITGRFHREITEHSSNSSSKNYWEISLESTEYSSRGNHWQVPFKIDFWSRRSEEALQKKLRRQQHNQAKLDISASSRQHKIKVRSFQFYFISHQRSDYLTVIQDLSNSGRAPTG